MSSGPRGPAPADPAVERSTPPVVAPCSATPSVAEEIRPDPTPYVQGAARSICPYWGNFPRVGTLSLVTDESAPVTRRALSLRGKLIRLACRAEPRSASDVRSDARSTTRDNISHLNRGSKKVFQCEQSRNCHKRNISWRKPLYRKAR